MICLVAVWLLSLLTTAEGSVTVYGQIPFGLTATSSAPGSVQTTLAAYNDTVLNPPPLPSPLPPTTLDLELSAVASAVSGLSIPQSGSFFGFSVEMSVVTQIREFIACVFLSLCSSFFF